jgi:hypothetical protein
VLAPVTPLHYQIQCLPITYDFSLFRIHHKIGWMLSLRLPLDCGHFFRPIMKKCPQSRIKGRETKLTAKQNRGREIKMSAL